jgi:glycosyltransferase involved in cell wall biosynthesis
MNEQIHILLATYNGAEYLQEQLDSIAAQTHRNWALHVADDDSSDSTIDIIDSFSRCHQGKVKRIQFRLRASSPKANFMRLLREVSSESKYLALCDQDDVWVEHKLEALLTTCKAVEERGGIHPCLVYSDLMVADANLEVRARSFMAQIATRPSRLSFAQLLLENSIPGCSAMLNGALLRLVQDYAGPLDDIIMHDWWLALIAMGCGRVGFVQEPLVYYRQHNSNVAGSVKRSGLQFVLRKVWNLADASYSKTLTQAKLLESVYGDSLDSVSAEMLAAYCRFDRLGKVERVRECLARGILKQARLRRVQQIIAI